MQNTKEVTSVDISASGPKRPTWPALAESASFYLLIGTLAWAPFPLGSNRPWSWTLLTFLVSISWLLWLTSSWKAPASVAESLRRVAVPFILASSALLWGFVQICPWVPEGWLHPVWGIATEGLNKPVSGMISLNGWLTATELMKLITYIMAGGLAYVLCQKPNRAKRMVDSLITVGALYAALALVMAMLGLQQVQIFYSTPPFGSPVAAPFVTHAGFASFVGMILMCACVRLFALGAESIVSIRGPRLLLLTTLKFAFGRGTPLLLSVLILFSMLIASASRAGFLSALIGVAVLLVFAMILGARQPVNRWTVVAAVTVAFTALVLFQINGATLQNRLNELVKGDATFDLRAVLWSAAAHMTSDTPFRGLGLGSFEHAYPLYADGVYPYNMDKAHNDYLELVAGWGLPAAFAWLSALLWLVVQCSRGVLLRRRNQIYPLAAVAATALVALHSVFDFTLQLPAVSLTYALILGCGVAQSFSSRV